MSQTEQPSPGAPSAPTSATPGHSPIYDERDRLVILTPCFAHQVTTYFRDSVDRVLGGELTARFRCRDGSVHVMPIVAMAINQPNDSHIDRARNTILWHFEQTPYNLALFCDGDQPFTPEDIARTWSRLMSGVRVLGGCVALKTIVTTFAANLKPGSSAIPGPDGLLDGNDTGTGWMGFHRNVLQEMRTRWPEYIRRNLADALGELAILKPIYGSELPKTEPIPNNHPMVDRLLHTLATLGFSADISYRSNSNTATAGQTLHAYFASGVVHREGAGDWLSEDWMFCHRCRLLGIPVKIDPMIKIKHFGPMLFPPDPAELIEAALQATSGRYPPFDPRLAAQAADALQRLVADQKDQSITVLHATRHRPEQAKRMRQVWLDAALHPESIQYLLAIDSDDIASAEALKDLPLVTCSLSLGRGIVAAINEAAKSATGRILVMAADDCTPPKHWDREILASLKGQMHEPRVLWTSDGYSNQPVITHPIMTRAFYQQQGYFFCPEYPHLFCDTELTVRASAAGQVIDARHLTFRHDHPMFTGLPSDALHQERNSQEAWATGRAIFRRRNPEARHFHASPPEA